MEGTRVKVRFIDDPSFVFSFFFCHNREQQTFENSHCTIRNNDLPKASLMFSLCVRNCPRLGSLGTSVSGGKNASTCTLMSKLIARAICDICIDRRGNEPLQLSNGAIRAAKCHARANAGAHPAKRLFNEKRETKNRSCSRLRNSDRAARHNTYTYSYPRGYNTCPTASHYIDVKKK